MAGKTPWMSAPRALSGDDTSSTTAASTIDPAPAKMSAAPTAVEHIANAMTPTVVTTARNRL